MSLDTRFYALTAIRWLPVGLTFGLIVLLPLERGLSMTQIGLLLSIQGFVVLGLEIPSGAIADTLGRKPVLIVGTFLAIFSTALFVSATSFALFAVSLVLQGVYRALDSGPLEAWYVDNADPLRVPTVLARASTVLGVTIAGGALIGGGLIAWNPLHFSSALVLPYLVAIAVGALNMVALFVWVGNRRPESLSPNVTEDAPGRSRVPTDREPRENPKSEPCPSDILGDPFPDPAIPVADAPSFPTPEPSFLPPDTGEDIRPGALRALRTSAHMLRHSRALQGLLAVEVFWAVAMIAFETLSPLRLADLVGSADRAGAIFGPASAVAWGLFSLGSLASSWLAPRFGVVPVAIVGRLLNGLMVIGMGVAGGVTGLLIGYGLAYTTHGIAGPMHSALLHSEATNANRATILSLNSLVAGATYSVGLLILTALADSTSLSTAIVAAGAFSMLGALCYLPALRHAKAKAKAKSTLPSN